MFDNSPLAFLVGILLIGILLAIVIAISKRGTVQLDVNKYRTRWITIERHLQRDQEASYHLCVLNADKLLDQALRERGTKGKTMGERMKNSQNIWSNANSVWTAHKLRNRIAHEDDAKVSYDETRRALSSFRQALKDVGAI